MVYIFSIWYKSILYLCCILICRCLQKHNDAMKTSGHRSLEKYTSHFIWKGSKGLLKVLLCERWVGDRTELQHIDPHSYGHNSISFPFSWAVQPGAWGPSLSGTWSSFQHLVWTPTGLNSNWLNFLCTECFHTSCGRHKSHSFNPSTVKVISGYSSTGCTCYLHRCISYFDSLAGSAVNIQHFVCTLQNRI